MAPISEATERGSLIAPDIERTDRNYAILSFICGLLAFASSAMLVYEHLQIAKDAAHVSVCDVNALLNCGTVMRTPFAEAFGFPNPYIGLVGYAIILTVATAIFAKARFSRWYWLCLNIGHVLAFCFIVYLWFNTTFVINALCLFCMIVWIMQTLLMVRTTARNVIAGVIPAPAHIREAVGGWSWFAAVLIYVLIFGIIIIHFFDIILAMFT